MSAYDDQNHDEEADIHRNDHQYWYNECPHKVTVWVQPTPERDQNSQSERPKQSVTCSAIASRPGQKKKKKETSQRGCLDVRLMCMQSIPGKPFLSRLTQCLLCLWSHWLLECNHNHSQTHGEWPSRGEHTGPCTRGEHLQIQHKTLQPAETSLW